MKNKVVCITGATSGFGEACALKFAALGAVLVLSGRRNDRLLALQTTLESDFGTESYLVNCDVQIESDVIAAFSKVPEEVLNNVAVLVNNAGLALGREPFYEGNSSDWNQMIDTNVKGLLYVAKFFANKMIPNKAGQIINIASIAGKEAYLGGNVYCASKQAVDSLSKSMRIDLVQHGIKVTNIAPGAADTEFSIVRYKGDATSANNTYIGFDPLMAEDVADAVVYTATRPKHVCINDLVIMPTAQASATIFHKE